MKEIRAVVFDWGNTVIRKLASPEGQEADQAWAGLIPGVAEALEQLRSHVICCVASGSDDPDSEQMGEELDRAGLRESFGHLFTTQDLGVKERDAGFFAEILRRLDLEPWECLVVGDDYENDIKPARSVGMRTILYAQVAPLEPAFEADAVINSMSQLACTVVEVDNRGN